jgi:hypothetical protein
MPPPRRSQPPGPPGSAEAVAAQRAADRVLRRTGPAAHAEAVRVGLMLGVYVPRGPHRETAHIVPGSAIVGTNERYGPARDRLRVYWEGNLYGAVNLRTPEDKLRCAAGRLVASYPTIAQGTVPAEALALVGVYHYGSHQLDVVDPARWRAWLAQTPTGR